MSQTPVEDSRAAPWRRRALLALVAWVLLESLCAGALRFVAARGGLEYRRLSGFFDEGEREEIASFLERGEGQYYRPDPELGWVPRPSSHVPAMGDYAPTKTNAAGLRSLREYAPEPPPGVLRVAAFGDSFVHGDEVGDEDCWTAVLERSRPATEVLNFGASGYGPDQAMLRWLRDGRALRPRVVVIGFMTENIGRTVNVFRPFYTPQTKMRMSKPRFLLEGDRLVLLPNPVRSLAEYRGLLDDPAGLLGRLGRNDVWFARSGWASSRFDVLPSVRLATLGSRALRIASDPRSYDPGWHPDGIAFRTTESILREFVSSVEAAGALPIVVLFPNRNDVERRRAGHADLSAPLQVRLRARGFATLNLMDALERDAGEVPADRLFGRSHYTAAANAIVARAISAALDTAMKGAALLTPAADGVAVRR